MEISIILLLVIIGIYLINFIIFLVNKIINKIRSKNVDISWEIWTVSFFLSPSIIFLTLVILEVINKCV